MRQMRRRKRVTRMTLAAQETSPPGPGLAVLQEPATRTNPTENVATRPAVSPAHHHILSPSTGQGALMLQGQRIAAGPHSEKIVLQGLWQ